MKWGNNMSVSGYRGCMMEPDQNKISDGDNDLFFEPNPITFESRKFKVGDPVIGESFHIKGKRGVVYTVEEGGMSAGISFNDYNSGHSLGNILPKELGRSGLYCSIEDAKILSPVECTGPTPLDEYSNISSDMPVKLGDVVKFLPRYSQLPNGKIGVVVSTPMYEKYVGVSFEDFSGGHNLGGHLGMEDKSGWNCYPQDLFIIGHKEVKINKNDYVSVDGKTGWISEGNLDRYNDNSYRIDFDDGTSGTFLSKRISKVKLEEFSNANSVKHYLIRNHGFTFKDFFGYAGKSQYSLKRGNIVFSISDEYTKSISVIYDGSPSFDLIKNEDLFKLIRTPEKIIEFIKKLDTPSSYFTGRGNLEMAVNLLHEYEKAGLLFSSGLQSGKTKVEVREVIKEVIKEKRVKVPPTEEEIKSAAEKLVKERVDKEVQQLRENFYNMVKGKEVMDKVQEIKTQATELFDNQMLKPLQSEQGMVSRQNPLVAKSYSMALSQLNSNKSVLEFGQDVADKPGVMASKILKSTYLRDLDQIAKPIAELSLVCKETTRQISASSGKTFWSKVPLIRKYVHSAISTIDKAKLYFENSGDVVDKLVKNVDQTIPYMKSLNDQLKQLQDDNEGIYYEVTGYIEAGSDFLNQKNDELITLDTKHKLDPENRILRQQMLDLNDYMDQLNRAILEFRALQAQCEQNHIRLRNQMQTGVAIVEKFNSTKRVFLSSWKTSLTSYVIALEQGKALLFYDNVRKTTNEVLKKATSATNENMISAQEHLNSSLIDVDTLIETSNQLSESLDKITEIKKIGREKVLENHQILIDLQKDLRTKSSQLTISDNLLN